MAAGYGVPIQFCPGAANVVVLDLGGRFKGRARTLKRYRSQSIVRIEMHKNNQSDRNAVHI